MANSADLDQLASSEANRYGSTMFAKSYPGLAGQGLSFHDHNYFIYSTVVLQGCIIPLTPS